MNKLAIFAPCTPARCARVDELCCGWLEPVYSEEKAPMERQLELLPQAEVIFGEPQPQLLQHAAQLRWLQISWAGADSFMGHLSEDVQFTNASGAYGEVISEHCMAMLLALARRLPAYLARQRQGFWEDCGTEWTLNDKQILILGAGDLGSQLAKRLQGFGCTVTGLCRRARGARPPFDRLITIDEMDAFLPQADAVIGCLPGTAQTAGLLHAGRLAAMKRDAIVLNVGRGSLIDLDALARLMQNGHFFGAGLDVTNPEPLPQSHPLWQQENVILTPHIAGVGFGHLQHTEDAIWELFLDNLRRYRDGQPLVNQVSRTNGY